MLTVDLGSDKLAQNLLNCSSWGFLVCRGQDQPKLVKEISEPAMTEGAGPSMKETDRNKHPAKSASEFI